MPRSTIDAAAVDAYVGLGANLGDARATLREACDELAALQGTTLVELSSIWRSAPVDAIGPNFLNAVVALRTTLSPAALLLEMQRIELAHGRERSYRNAPRTLDLDLLLYGSQEIETASLIVPHPRMHGRAFVLCPLSEIAPGLQIPNLGPLTALLPAVADQRIERLDKLGG